VTAHEFWQVKIEWAGTTGDTMIDDKIQPNVSARPEPAKPQPEQVGHQAEKS
jgi:hypothetical protein